MRSSCTSRKPCRRGDTRRAQHMESHSSLRCPCLLTDDTACSVACSHGPDKDSTRRRDIQNVLTESRGADPAGLPTSAASSCVSSTLRRLRSLDRDLISPCSCNRHRQTASSQLTVLCKLVELTGCEPNQYECPLYYGYFLIAAADEYLQDAGMSRNIREREEQLHLSFHMG